MEKENIDAFTDHVINSIDFKVYNSLSHEQLSAIRAAVGAHKPRTKHAVDIRSTIPLLFFRLYFVFFMGRDRRTATEAIEEERREKVSLAGNMLFLCFVLSGLLLFAAILIYILKSMAGIDIVPGEHMGRIFGL